VKPRQARPRDFQFDERQTQRPPARNVFDRGLESYSCAERKRASDIEKSKRIGTSFFRAAEREAVYRQQPTNVVAEGSTDVGEPVVTMMLWPMRAATAPLRRSGSDGSAVQASSPGS
jgi:hypothetical protein